MSCCLFCLKFRCRSRIIVDCVLNFVAMATRVGHGRICVTSFDSPTPKTPCWTQRSPRYLVYKPSYIANFASNFVAMATSVGRGRICVTSFNSPNPKTPCWTQRSPRYLVYKPSYRRFCPKFHLLWQRDGNWGWSFYNLTDIIG